MKRFLFYTVVSLCLLSCVQNNNTTNVAKEVVEVKPYKVIELIDTIVSIYPNLYVNDVQKERFLTYLYMELDKNLTEDNDYLSEIPLQFSQMLKKNKNKYLVKFECGQYTTNDTKLKSKASKTEIDYAIFAEVDADFASTLEDKAFYTLTGTYQGYVDRKLVLPSGKVFTYPRRCYKTSFEEFGSVCLGGFLFENISVTKTQISK